MKKTIIKIITYVCLIVVSTSCEKDNFIDPDDAIYGVLDENVNEDFNGILLEVDASDQVEIHPDIFGVNNDWRQVPDNSFAGFADVLDGLHTEIIRYPGGWESEFYAWSSNTTPGWENTPSKPGASVATLKDNVTNYSIVIPTVPAMNQTIGSSNWNAAIAQIKSTAKKAIELAEIQTQSGIVEIGNEWWLQYAGGATRAKKLEKYVKISVELAQYIQTTFPDRTFKLLINGDYTRPEEFTSMRNQFTQAYQEIDGVALHTYTGYSTSTHNISELESRIKACSENFNPEKQFIYLSEWMPSRDYNDRALYMEAANLIPDIIHIYARSKANAAAYWPPINSSVPGLGITNWNAGVVYPVGQILGELSASYKGFSLKTTGSKFHIAAALNDSSTLVVFITGGNEKGAKVGVKFNGFDVSSIQSVERFVPADYQDTAKAASYVKETATAQLSNNQLVLDINKEGSYQIYKIVLKGSEI